MTEVTQLRPPRRKRVPLFLIWIVGLAVVWTAYPPFRIRHLTTSPARIDSTLDRPRAFDAQAEAADFWKSELMPFSTHAVNLDVLLPALLESDTAASKYGRRRGIGGKYYYLVRGEGRLASIDRKAIAVDINGPKSAKVLLVIGPVFGNALRDATDLFPGNGLSSFEFNAFGAALNRIAEVQVQSQYQNAPAGSWIAFSGAAETEVVDGALVMRVIPIQAVVRHDK
jgi:predicted lipoprotein